MRYQHFEEIVGALRAQIFRSEFMHVIFQWLLHVFASGTSKSGWGRGSQEQGLINLGPKSEASLWGRGGFINRRSLVQGGLCRGRFSAGTSRISGSEFGPRDPSSCIGLVLLCILVVFFSPGA